MASKRVYTRRDLLQAAGIMAAGAALAGCVPKSVSPSTADSQSGPPATKKTIELVHWHYLTASDGEVWQQTIDAFNEAYQNKGIQIKPQVIHYDEYGTKLLAATAAGRAPDFGWGAGGLRAKWIKEGVVVPLDELAKQVGLDLDDFTPKSLEASRYPKYGNQLYMVPMDAMSLQMLVNLDHVQEAGLDINQPPETGEQLLEWAKAMTKLSNGKVLRSGILMTGSGVQPTVTWGIVAAQMGFQRASEDLKKAAVNPEAGKAAMQWILDLFDKHKVSTRDVTDRYKAFGTGDGSTFWTGPWTLNGYLEQGLNFTTLLFPNIGGQPATYYELGGLELYTQKDTSRYEATMEAVKWLSDHSFPWTTVGRGAAVRNSILARDDYNQAGPPWKVRGPFIEGLEFATLSPIPVEDADDFEIYSSNNFLATTLASVWTGEKSIDQAMDELAGKWQQALDKG